MRAEARFFDGEIAREHPVVIELLPEGLAIESAQVMRRVWPLAGLSAVAPAQAGYPLRLTHAAEPGARLIITHEAFAKELIRSAPHLAGGFNLKKAGRVAAIIAASALLAIGILYFVLSYAPQTLAFILPESWRKTMGEEMEAALVSSNAKLCAASGGNAALKTFANRLKDGNPEAPAVELKVYDINILNAFALPGDRVVITKKLIDATDTPEELAGVLAHEMGHIVHRHPEAQLIRTMGIDLLLRLAAGGGNTASQFAGLLAVLRYSRDAEREADSFAHDALIKAAIDPMGLKRFFEKIMKLEGEHPTKGGLFSTMSDMMSTHPVTDERIKAIKPLPQGTIARPVLSDQDWTALRKICG